MPRLHGFVLLMGLALAAGAVARVQPDAELEQSQFEYETRAFSGEDLRSAVGGVLRRDPVTGKPTFVSQRAWSEAVLEHLAFGKKDASQPLPGAAADASDLLAEPLDLPSLASCKGASAVPHSSALGDRNYSASASAMFARYAAAAYCVDTKKDLESWTCKACKELPKTTQIRLFSVTNTSTHAFVGFVPTANLVTVVFAGTDPFNIKNWITDLVFVKTAYPFCDRCEVHLGFLEAYKSVRVGIAGYVAELLRAHPGSAVSVTGHSLGAAIAHHAIVDWFKAGIPVVFPTYVFGSPRVGNGEFAAYIYSAFRPYGLYRVVHWRDPVSQLPQTFLGFEHSPMEIWYDAPENSYKICAPNTGEDKSCSHKDNIVPWLPDVIYHQSYGKFDYTANYISCKI